MPPRSIELRLPNCQRPITPSSSVSTQIRTNTFDSGPHKPSEVVLDVRNDWWKMEVVFRAGGYTVYLLAFGSDGKPAWTRLSADGGATPAGARLVARKFWGEIANSPS